MRKPLLSLLAAAAAAGLAGVADSPARAASMDPFTEQQQTDEALNHAIRLYREGDYAEAEKITRTFLRFNPGSAQAHEVLGAILLGFVVFHLVRISNFFLKSISGACSGLIFLNLF